MPFLNSSPRFGPNYSPALPPWPVVHHTDRDGGLCFVSDRYPNTLSPQPPLAEPPHDIPTTLHSQRVRCFFQDLTVRRHACGNHCNRCDGVFRTPNVLGFGIAVFSNIGNSTPFAIWQC